MFSGLRKEKEGQAIAFLQELGVGFGLDEEDLLEERE